MNAQRRRAGSTDFGTIDFGVEDERGVRRRRKNEPMLQQPNATCSSSLAPSIASTSTSEEPASRITTFRSSISLRRASSSFTVECPEKYADARQMTAFQEKVNAVTILPSFFLCLYYILSEKWILPETIELAKELLAGGEQQQDVLSSQHGCAKWASAYFSFPSMPPPTVLAVCLGVMVHCPWSFIYHWKYAANPNPAERLKHWSRRMDHSAIHAASICWSFAISGGSWACMLLNLLYNADCIRCHWEEEIKPRRNQVRILVSMLLYTSPLLFMHDDNEEDGRSKFSLFRQIWSYFVVAVWCFVAYPIGGWSHAAFHIVMVAVPYLLLDMAAKMEAEGNWSLAAARCVLWRSFLE